MVVVENYPDLKANENFIRLQDELAGTENRIAVARKDYNEAAQEFNTLIKKIPRNIIAGIAGFESHDYFEADEGAGDVPEVSF
jgi:LemA protein